ncbi:hypothetical protein INR49_007273 [Caranx melampygus]|nr:hypothetical protein INR49_007273 [Caranx melampygus]
MLPLGEIRRPEILRSVDFSDALLNSLLEDPYLSLQLAGKANQQVNLLHLSLCMFSSDRSRLDTFGSARLGSARLWTSSGSTDGTTVLTLVLVPPLQFTAENPADGLSLNHSGLSCTTDKSQFPANSQGPLGLQDPGDQQLLNNQNQNYSSGDGRHNVPNIILTGDSPPGLSKEIASALSHVPGFEMDPFSLDDPLRMDPLALDMLDGDLMLADPAVEDSFRSDRLK